MESKTAVIYLHTRVDISLIVGAFGYIYADVGTKAKYYGGKLRITDKGFRSVPEMNKYVCKDVDPTEYLFGYMFDNDTTKPYSTLAKDTGVMIQLLPEDVEKVQFHFATANVRDFMKTIMSSDALIDDDLTNPSMANILKTSATDRNITLEFMSSPYDETFHHWATSSIMSNVAFNRSIGDGIHKVVIQTSTPQEFLKCTIERNDLMDMNYILFKINEKSNNKIVSAPYKVKDSATNAGKNKKKEKSDIELGKKTNEVQFASIHLSDIDPQIIIVKDVLKKLLGSHSVICKVDLSVLYNKNIYPLLTMFGSDIAKVIHNRRETRLEVSDGTNIASVIKPQGIAFKVFERTDYLDFVLNEYLEFKQSGTFPKHREFIDITDTFYETNEKGKNVLKPEYGSGLISVKYNYLHKDKDIPIFIQLALDTISRNQMKRLEKKEPKIILVVTKMNEAHIEYHTIVDILEANNEISSYTTHSSNKVIIRAIK